MRLLDRLRALLRLRFAPRPATGGSAPSPRPSADPEHTPDPLEYDLQGDSRPTASGPKHRPSSHPPGRRPPAKERGR